VLKISFGFLDPLLAIAGSSTFTSSQSSVSSCTPTSLEEHTAVIDSISKHLRLSKRDAASNVKSQYSDYGSQSHDLLAAQEELP
jgi:hypothetical protein